MRRHAPMAWDGQRLPDMFHLHGLGILLHLVPTPSRVVDSTMASVRLATAAGMMKGIAVGMEEATEVTAAGVREMTRPETGKNPGPGSRRVSQSSSALEGRE